MATTKIPLEYIDYTAVFSPDLAMELPKNININEYTIKLVEDKPLPYTPIYSPGLIELETQNVYIVTYLKTRFIKPS